MLSSVEDYGVELLVSLEVVGMARVSIFPGILELWLLVAIEGITKPSEVFRACISYIFSAVRGFCALCNFNDSICLFY